MVAGEKDRDRGTAKGRGRERGKDRGRERVRLYRLALYLFHLRPVILHSNQLLSSAVQLELDRARCARGVSIRLETRHIQDTYTVRRCSGVLTDPSDGTHIQP